MIEIGRHRVGDNCPVYIIAQIGINHNGELDVAKKLVAADIVLKNSGGYGELSVRFAT